MRTRITNNSGAKRFFGFVPPHGKELEGGADVVIDGDLRTILGAGEFCYPRRRSLDSLDREVAAGDVLVETVADPSSSSSSSAAPSSSSSA